MQVWHDFLIVLADATAEDREVGIGKSKCVTLHFFTMENAVWHIFYYVILPRSDIILWNKGGRDMFA